MYNELEYFTYTNNQKQKIKEMEFQPTEKATLNGQPTVNKDAKYFIDFSKLNKIEDLIMILACCGFVFSPQHPHWELLQPFIALDKPILPDNTQGFAQLKLTKLKPVTKENV